MNGVAFDELGDEFLHLGTVLEPGELDARRHVVLDASRVAFALVKQPHDRVIHADSFEQRAGQVRVVVGIVQAVNETVRRLDRSTLATRQDVDLVVARHVRVEQVGIARAETLRYRLHLVDAELGESVEGSVGEGRFDLVEHAGSDLVLVVGEASFDRFAFLEVAVGLEEELRFGHLAHARRSSTMTQQNVDLLWASTSSSSTQKRKCIFISVYF